MIVEQNKRKCAHDGCTCEVYQGQTYCGPHCAAAAAKEPPENEAVCACGHDDCKAHEQSQPHGKAA